MIFEIFAFEKSVSKKRWVFGSFDQKALNRNYTL